jgi:hypothetical protein
MGIDVGMNYLAVASTTDKKCSFLRVVKLRIFATSTNQCEHVYNRRELYLQNVC